MPLLPAEVQVWRFPLDLTASAIEMLAQTLSPDEAARAHRFVSERDRRRWIAGRGQLRALLGRTLGCRPREIALEYTNYGKPFLVGVQASLRFNLSHADNIALVALAWNREVGVDLERIRDDIALETLASRFLPPSEADALFHLPPAERPPAFFRAWVRHEACLKALGMGFSTPADPPPFDPAFWRCRDLEVGPNQCAALVVQRLTEAEENCPLSGNTIAEFVV